MRKYSYIIIIVLYVLIAFPLAQCYAGSLSDDVQALVKDNPQGYANLCWQAAVFYQQSGNFQKSLDWIDRVIQMEPGDLNIQFYKAQLLLELKRYNDAENVLDRLNNEPRLKDAPLLVNVRGLLYQSYKTSGKISSKEKDIEKIIKGKKPTLDSYRQALMMYRVSESFDKTIDAAKKAIKAYPDESSFRLALSYAYERKNMPKDALKEYKSTFQKFQDNLTAGFKIVDIDMQLSMLDDANAQLDKVQKSAAGNAQALAQVKQCRDAIAAQQAKNKLAKKK